jgi:hypothetical protein
VRMWDSVVSEKSSPSVRIRYSVALCFRSRSMAEVWMQTGEGRLGRATEPWLRLGVCPFLRSMQQWAGDKGVDALESEPGTLLGTLDVGQRQGDHPLGVHRFWRRLICALYTYCIQSLGWTTMRPISMS